jgi:anti-sigma factor RsiW
MSTISHADITLLQALADNELPASQVATLRSRLAAEPALADAYSELALTRAMMEDLPVARPPRSLRLDRQTMQRARGWRWWLIAPPGGQFVPAMGLVACLCLALLFGTGYGQGSSTDRVQLKGSIQAPLVAEAPADVPQESTQAVPLIAPQPDPSLLPLFGVTAGLVGTVGSARWWMRLRKIQRKAS